MHAERFKNSFHLNRTFILLVSDLIALLLAINIGPFFKFFFPALLEGLPPSFSVMGCTRDIVTWLILQLIFLRAIGLYSEQATSSRVFALVRISLAMTLSTICFVGISCSCVLPNAVVSFWRWVALNAVFSTIIVWGIRQITLTLVPMIWHSSNEENILFAGWSLRMEKALKSLQNRPKIKTHIIGFLQSHDELSTIFATEKGFHDLGRMEDIENIIKKKNIDRIIVNDDGMEAGELNELAKACSRCLINLQVIPSAFDTWISGLSLQIIDGVPILGIKSLRHEHLHNRIVKRMIDIAGALVGLTLSAPIILICGFLIRRESPGPIFYKQIRMGAYGRLFSLIKLRSMRLDAEVASGPVWAKEGDPRRLKIGTFMRKWNLDETPQFWNVLKGDMSLVGPRPERPEFVEAFNQTIHHYNLRHTCKPGLTGWAAIHGLRGNTSLAERIHYDLYYMEHWSLIMDFRIMLQTFLPPRNAY